MNVTVAVVTYQAEQCIAKCLEALLAMAPHGGELELLVVDGNSSDATRDRVKGFGKRVRLVVNPGRTIASNRNAALRQARHEFIAFTDADCVVPRDWLAVLCRKFEALQAEDGAVVGVGGCSRAPAGRGRFLRALGVARDSLLGGSGSVQGRVYSECRKVGSLGCFNVLYRRESLQAVGGFDEALGNMCEDADINYRLRRSGSSLVAVPGIEVEHASRATFRDWCRNMHAYGVGRGIIMRKHGTLFSPAYLLPLLLLPGLMGGTVLALAGHAWALAVWLYVPAVAVSAILAAVKHRMVDVLPVIAILLGSHLCYGLGLWQGLVRDRTSSGIKGSR